MITPDPTPLGLPYAIGETVLNALRTDADLIGLPIAENPASPADLADGERILIFRDQSDVLIEQPGQVPKRTYSCQVGGMARTDQARRDAHADYRAAKRAVRDALTELRAAGVRITSGMREASVTYQYDDAGIDGALVLGTFSVDYRDPDG